MGRALFSYIQVAATWADDDPRLCLHTNAWESRELARTLSGLGFDVDAVAWDDTRAAPDGPYDVVFAIDEELVRLGDVTGAERLLLHVTGCYPRFNNEAELRRLDELERRRGVRCAPRRLVRDLDGFDRALDRATEGTLLGNGFTLAQFPAAYRGKLTTIDVTASPLAEAAAAERPLPPEREFLWFFGSGAIHKGLDLVLEVFAERPSLTLNVVGNIASEDDFVAAYRRELTGLPNIRFHGFLEPAGSKLTAILLRSAAFVAPSCSEGVSTAAATCMVAGLLPIVSRETGLTLPPGAGTLLEECSLGEIADAVERVAGLPAPELFAETAACRDLARARYGRAAFSAAARTYLARATGPEW